MNTKLTLSIDKSTIEKAKLYAKQSGRSLSDLVESYLNRLIKASETEEEIPEEFKDLFGSLNLSADVDDKAILRKIIHDKHKK